MKSIAVIVLGSLLNASILKLFAYLLKIEDRTFGRCFTASIITICLYLGLFSSGIVTSTTFLNIIYFLVMLACALYILRATFTKAVAISLMLISPTLLSQW